MSTQMPARDDTKDLRGFKNPNWCPQGRSELA